jgi:dipeptidase
MPAGALWTPESGKPGAVWCAERVPDDQVSVCPNESRIGEIDLSNQDYFLASPNAVSFAVEQKLYDPASGQPFNWKRAYSPGAGSALSTNGGRQRMWRFYSAVAPSKNFAAGLENMDFPFAVKPDQKLSVQDVMTLTRDKSYGTVFDPVKGIRGGPFQNPNFYTATRKISVSNAEYTTVTQCRGWLPDSIGGLTWLAWGDQATACYMPFYAGVTTMPKSFGVGDHFILNRASARWAFDYVDFHVQPVYSEAIKDVQKAQLEWETGALTRIPEIDKQAQALYAKSPAEAVKLVTKFSNENAEKVVAAWWDLGDALLVKYDHFGFYDAAKRTRARVQLYGSVWNKAVRMVDIWLEK